MSPAVILERPQLAILISLITTHWTNLESTLSLMYTYLLFGQEESAFQFYHDLVDISLRKKAFMAAAKDKLPKQTIDDIDKLYVDVRKAAVARNTVIHATWAITDSKPSSLLLCDPKALNAKVNQVFRHLLRMVRTPGPHTSVSVDLTPDSFIEYKLTDFNDINERTIALEKRAMALANQVLTRILELTTRPSSTNS